MKIVPRIRIAPSVQKRPKTPQMSKTWKTLENVQNLFPQPPSRKIFAAADAATAAAAAAVRLPNGSGHRSYSFESVMTYLVTCARFHTEKPFSVLKYSKLRSYHFTACWKLPCSRRYPDAPKIFQNILTYSRRVKIFQ